jgi:hypothetical protein
MFPWYQHFRGTDSALSENRVLRPVLRRVINAQDFDGLLLHAVNSDIGQRTKQNFSGAFRASGSAAIWRQRIRIV